MHKSVIKMDLSHCVDVSCRWRRECRQLWGWGWLQQVQRWQGTTSAGRTAYQLPILLTTRPHVYTHRSTTVNGLTECGELNSTTSHSIHNRNESFQPIIPVNGGNPRSQLQWSKPTWWMTPQSSNLVSPSHNNSGLSWTVSVLVKGTAGPVERLGALQTLWWDPNDVPHCRILPFYQAEWWSASA